MYEDILEIIMKKLLLCSAVLALSLLTSACTTRTRYGDCIGVGDNPEPQLNYRFSAWNIAVGVVFSETIVVPIIVVVDELKCPVSKKNGVL